MEKCVVKSYWVKIWIGKLNWKKEFHLNWFLTKGLRRSIVVVVSWWWYWWTVWPDWEIYRTLGNFSKPLATIILPKLPIFYAIFCKCVKIYLFIVKSFLGNFYRHLAIFFWSLWRGGRVVKGGCELVVNTSKVNVQLLCRLFPTPEIRGSNTVTGKFYLLLTVWNLCWKEENNEKTAWKWAIKKTPNPSLAFKEIFKVNLSYDNFGH